MKKVAWLSTLFFVASVGEAHAQWAPYPQQPYPPPPYPPPPPPWQSPPPSSFDHPKGFMGSVNLLLGVSHLVVAQDTKRTTTAGGLIVNAAGNYFDRGLSGRARIGAMLGGGNAGMDAMVGADVSGGIGYTFGNSQLFLRLDAEGYDLKNDELEASTTLLGGSGGLQVIADGLGFELSPIGGFAGRTEYEPGDESAGRRFWRRVGPRGAYGGRAVVYTSFLELNGTLLRVADSDPVTMVDANACVVVTFISACGFVQYWNSVATDPVGQPHTVPSTWFGIGLGIGAVKAKSNSGPLDFGK